MSLAEVLEYIAKSLFCFLSSFFHELLPTAWPGKWLERFCVDATLRLGAFEGVVALTIIGFLTQKFLSLKRAALKMFKPEKEGGPSPIGIVWDSVKAVVFIFILILVVAWTLIISDP